MKKMSDESGGRLYVGTNAKHVFVQCDTPEGIHMIPLTVAQARELSDHLKDAAQFMQDLSMEDEE